MFECACVCQYFREWIASLTQGVHTETLPTPQPQCPLRVYRKPLQAFNAIFNETKAQFHAMLKAWARGDKDLETRLREHHAVQPNPYRRPTRRQRHRPTEAAHSPSTSPSPSPSLPLLPSLSQEKSKKSLSLEHPSARIDPDLAELFADMPSEEGAAAASLAPASERVTATKTHTGVKPKDDFFASYGL